MLRRHLILAERHVASCEETITRLKALILKLERGGHDVGGACTVLDLFEAVQAICVKHRDRLAKKVAQPLH
jgi:hypothetical protein